jgi:hypothetical protein
MLQFIAQLRRKCVQIVLAMTTKIAIEQITASFSLAFIMGFTAIIVKPHSRTALKADILAESEVSGK